jgi:hypothetical protein
VRQALDQTAALMFADDSKTLADAVSGNPTE